MFRLKKLNTVFKCNFSFTEITFFIVISLLTFSTYGQNYGQRLALTFNATGAYSLAPNKIDKTGVSLNGFASGFEFGILKQVSGKKSWHKTYGLPRMGISFQANFMNKPDTFGSNYAILPFVQLPLFQDKKNCLDAKISFGAAYATKLYDRLNNFENRAVSFPINFTVLVGAAYHLNLNQQVGFNSELGIFHISNGSFKIPNGGFNLFYIKAGLNVNINQSPYDSFVKPNYKLKKKRIFYSTYLAGAYREQGTFDYQRQFPVFTWSNALMKRVSKVFNTGVGLDLFYDASQYLIHYTSKAPQNYLLKVSEVSEDKKYLAAIGFCNELRISKLGLPLSFYHYIYHLEHVNQPLYLRFGLTYYPKKKLFMGCYFKGSINKNNSLESDFMEFALGWQFRK